jgi:hypothetical protein
MIEKPASPVLQFIRKIAASPQAEELTDGQLLERFAGVMKQLLPRSLPATGIWFTASASGCSAMNRTPRTPFRRRFWCSSARPAPSPNATRWQAGCMALPTEWPAKHAARGPANKRAKAGYRMSRVLNRCRTSSGESWQPCWMKK